MRTRAAQLSIVLVIAAFGAAAAAQSRPAQRGSQSRHHAKQTVKTEPPPLECGDYVAFQVLLDRQGFSPGAIDGRPGANLSHALSALQSARGLRVTGEPDCDTWRALGGDGAGALIASYTVADEDLQGPFVHAIPHDLMRQAELPTLGYRSAAEQIAEKFHASPTLLATLNPGLRLVAGGTIQVPAVQPFDVSTRPPRDPASEARIVVSREDSSLRAIGPDGAIVFFAPVTTGSAHDPLPIGDWKVVGIRWMPPFHYNPKLFWDANPNDTRATIKPGPNNPVGVVWIDLDRPHYGLHGTPEPSTIGRTASHGCVRLTNWDAARVTALVKPGTPVQFR
jgi:lipoprotein-anchoring transpeptidase ErfK/SrfK